ncbi:hypothetical protein Tco_0197122 [Tanacetum coccineum]
MNSLFCKQLIRIRSCLATTYQNKLYHIHVSIFKREHTVETGSKDLWSAVKTASGQRASGLGLGLWSAVETASSQRASGFGLGLWSAVETASGQRASGLGLGLSRAVFGCGNKIEKIRKLQRSCSNSVYL